jgi:hypothetical protein
MALIGYALMAKKMRIGLLLPTFASHISGGQTVAFEGYFQPDPFVDALRSIGVAVWLRLPECVKSRKGSTALEAWHTFKRETNHPLVRQVAETVCCPALTCAAASCSS